MTFRINGTIANAYASVEDDNMEPPASPEKIM